MPLSEAMPCASPGWLQQPHHRAQPVPAAKMAAPQGQPGEGRVREQLSGPVAMLTPAMLTHHNFPLDTFMNSIFLQTQDFGQPSMLQNFNMIFSTKLISCEIRTILSSLIYVCIYLLITEN